MYAENQTGNASLVGVVFKTFKWSILAVVPPRLCLIGLTFCQPLLLHKAMELSAEKVTVESTHVGYGLIGAYVLVYVGMAVCQEIRAFRQGFWRLILANADHDEPATTPDLPCNQHGTGRSSIADL
jgi:hypothetical protein